MSDHRHRLAAVLAGAVLLVSILPPWQAAAQAVAPAGVPGGALAIERLNQLGPEGLAIAGRIGLWDMTETLWASPEAAPVTMTGLVAERRMMGSLLQEFVRAPSNTTPEAVKRIDLLSYNRVEGPWDYVSFDTRAPVGLMPAWSSVRGDGSTIELTFQPFAFVGTGADVTGQMLRMDQVIRFPDADHDSKDQYFTMADGSGTRWLAHRYAYVRRP